MIIGEGTNEIQRTIIARQLIERHGERGGALVSRDGEPEERRRMLLAVRQVVDKSLIPVAAEHDRSGRVPDEIVVELADLGVFAALVPPAHGGLGLDPATWTMVIEEVARAWAAPALLAVAQGGVAWALGLAGGDTARHLPALGRADTLAAVVPVPAALARRDGSDYLLDGETAPVAHAARAGLLALTLADGTARWLVPATRPGCSWPTRPRATTPPLGARGASPSTPPWTSRSSPCASTAATATRRSSRSSAITATRPPCSRPCPTPRRADGLRPVLRRIQDRRGHQALAGPHAQRGGLHLVRAAHDEPASRPQRRALRRHPHAARPAPRARAAGVLDRYRDDGGRRLGQGDREPRDREDHARGADLHR